ncbi:hypothetical protein QJS04_geneDACA001991 [Acorus gramineus]|uniref:glutamate--cysteine ligase n=1 Tax=Acorus gramineus TaxID=55184 RepID=A0AAV9A9H5_ACOGR|nr:hypothetical protein QJS04_geneDACA001991 [Acorus gramineus]
MSLVSRTPPPCRIRAEKFRYGVGPNWAERVGCDAVSRSGVFGVKERVVGSSSLSWSAENGARALGFGASGCERLGHFIVAASPPTEDAIIATEPLTKEDLVDYLASGCKPREAWRIGTEHEKFGFEIDTLCPMKYGQIADLLNSLAERFDWDKIMEGDNIIGLQQGKQSISLEPGGQFELSGAPLETLHQTCAEVNSHLYQVKAVAEELGIGFLGIGFQPKWGLKDIPIMPKGRYEIMRNYMPKVGSLGLDMMFRTCTVQDISYFFGILTSPRKQIATALFANSPFTEGKPNGYLSMRSHIWKDTDKNRTGMLPFVFGDSFGFEQYVDYALDVPMYFVYRKKKYIDCQAKKIFRDEGCRWGAMEEIVCLASLLGNLGFQIVALIWVGLLYDDVALQNVLDMTSDWTEEEREMLRNEVPITGLKTPFRDGLLRHVAEDVVNLAKCGLESRGYKETGFLREVAEIKFRLCPMNLISKNLMRRSKKPNPPCDMLLPRVTPAEKLLDLYHGKWVGNVDPVYEELLY